MKKKLPGQRKTQRDKLGLLVVTMLHVRSANLVELASGLPRPTDRTDMRYQWISRFLANDLVSCDTVMEPFAREVLARAAEAGKTVTVIMDQSKDSDRHQILMLSLRWGERALPVAWRVEETEGAIGFSTQKALLDAAAPWLPPDAKVILMAWHPRPDRLVQKPRLGLPAPPQGQSDGLSRRQEGDDGWFGVVQRDLFPGRPIHRQALDHGCLGLWSGGLVVGRRAG